MLWTSVEGGAGDAGKCFFWKRAMQKARGDSHSPRKAVHDGMCGIKSFRLLWKVVPVLPPKKSESGQCGRCRVGTDVPAELLRAARGACKASFLQEKVPAEAPLMKA